MTRPPRLRLLLGAVLLLSAVAFVPSTLIADHAWGPYHWKRTSTNPVALTLGDNVSALWAPHFDQAVSEWDQSIVLALTPVAGATSPRACKPKSGKIEVCSEAYGQTGWLGLARIWVSGVHITAASTQVNDTYFVQYGAQYGYDTPEWRQFVMCQEIGHDFGLDHVDEAFDNPSQGTCMDYTNEPGGGGIYGPANTSPNGHDYEQLAIIYNHVDSSGGGGGRNNGAGRAIIGGPQTGAAQSEWGRLIRQNGRAALYRLDLGNGEYVFTFVIRA